MELIPGGKPIAFETERLWLRQWTPEDREPFHRMNSDPRVMEHFPAALSREESDALADSLTALISGLGWGCWALELKADKKLIGFAGLHVPKPDFPFYPCVEIAWRLAYGYWGMGLAHEAAQAALRFGFESLGLEEIVSFATLANRRSIALMERLGMDRGEEFDHPRLPPESPHRRHVLYRKAASFSRHSHKRAYTAG